MDNNRDVVIEVRDLHKKFKIYKDKSHSLKDSIISAHRNRYEEREVIKGVSFDIRKGEAVGLVGHNGCGKSTTLKMLTRIMYPDSGSINIKGRVSSLLELGAGFHPDLSGRENIYINASIFGLTKKEIDNKLDEIIAFSELEKFIDNPVRTYSSGMYMRLAFSVAINVNAEVLLIDEILGVGDVNFQAKCFNKLMEIKETGTTIVIVSHSTSQIERICDRSIWINDGKVAMIGKPVDVHREYLNYMYELKAAKEGKDKSEDDAGEMIYVKKAQLYNKEGQTESEYSMGDYLKLELTLLAKKTIEDYFIEVNLVRGDGLFIYGFSTLTDNITCEPWTGEKEITLAYEKLNLLENRYYFDVHVANSKGETIYYTENVAQFEVHTLTEERGTVFLEHQWIENHN